MQRHKAVAAHGGSVAFVTASLDEAA